MQKKIHSGTPYTAANLYACVRSVPMRSICASPSWLVDAFEAAAKNEPETDLDAAATRLVKYAAQADAGAAGIFFTLKNMDLFTHSRSEFANCLFLAGIGKNGVDSPADTIRSITAGNAGKYRIIAACAASKKDRAVTKWRTALLPVDTIRPHASAYRFIPSEKTGGIFAVWEPYYAPLEHAFGSKTALDRLEDAAYDPARHIWQENPTLWFYSARENWLELDKFLNRPTPDHRDLSRDAAAACALCAAQDWGAENSSASALEIPERI